ncbi:sensor histidine kinase [Alienimonas chondri]|uniref:histidine kinase n=1 Tax=Alienimonas chondri TaxID=2681879 RepID=A0ABX1VG88_9PLAN|nr:ATP-binding protein [Alienimonas chondri]NNJ27056.1 Sensor histidine kinase RcsC [Alienimonas chondri]
MSYRTLKRLLGETSLERKCRLLFGSGLLALIIGSFLLYRGLNRRVVWDQNRDMARGRVGSVLEEFHEQVVRRDAAPDAEAARVESTNFAPAALPDELRNFLYRVYAPDPSQAHALLTPPDKEGLEALAELRSGADEVTRIEESDDGPRFHLYSAARNDPAQCAACHRGAAPGALLGAVHVTVPLGQTRASLARNDVFLLTTGLVTAVLAMLAAWAIVRYVIVKPVLHLKEVADEIARGTLDRRSDIRTGDEFEELSQAFNRMLRHLITLQDELRDKNVELDTRADRLAQANMELYETNRLKDEFLATMSHELRTPLNSILGFSEVLDSAGTLDEKQRKWVGNIRNGGRDLKVLIDDILDLAKIESGKLEIARAPVDLEQLCHRQADALRPIAERKSIELTVDIDPSLPELQQDAGKLQQILNNLLSNAIKFTPSGGQVRVRGRDLGPRDRRGGVLIGPIGSGRHAGRWFEIIVSDTGIGIPLEDQAAIFEKFRQARGPSADGRATDAMTREHGGTGLGLSIVKELCRLLGGEVTCTSEYGRGSVFTVRLPCVCPEPEPPEPAEDPGGLRLSRSPGSAA